MLEYCPYCFEKLPVSRLNGPQFELVCLENPELKRQGRGGGHRVTIPYSEWKNWKKQGILPACPGHSNASRSSAKCEMCRGKALSQRACPFCHTDIRSTLINNKNLQFAIIGTRNSGKTVYITMLLDYMQKKMGAVYGSPLVPLEPSEGIRVEACINNMKQGKMPDNTTMDEVKPRLYQYGAGNSLNVMTIFDGAGEKFNDEALEAVLMRYVTQASGIILLFDPTAIPAVRDKLISSHVSSGEMTTASMRDVLQGIQLTYENYNQLHGNTLSRALRRGTRLSIPVAVVFSKFDLMFEYFNSGNAVLKASPNMDRNRPRFDEEDSLMVDEEIREWLLRLEQDDLIASIDKCFTNVRYFGVSSLGRSPGVNVTFAPHRIADPLLWLMHEKGLIN